MGIPACMTYGRNPQNLGVFFSAGSGYRKWNNEDNACVSAYSVQRCFNERNIEKENLEKKLTDLSGTSENCKEELSQTKAGNQSCQDDVKACRIESENERAKSFKIILVGSFVIILLLIIIVGLSVMIWKIKTKNAAKKEEIIGLDRLAPKHIYEPVDQEPEPEYEEVK
jgi:hypothetical protein